MSGMQPQTLACLLIQQLKSKKSSVHERLENLQKLLSYVQKRQSLINLLKKNIIQMVSTDRHPIHQHPQLIKTFFTFPSLGQNIQILAKLLRSHYKSVKVTLLSFLLEQDLSPSRQFTHFYQKEKLHELIYSGKGLILALLEDQFFQVRIAGIKLILKLRDRIPQATLKTALFHMINDQYDSVRIESVKALRQISLSLRMDQLQLQLLSMTLKDINKPLRLAVYSLSQVIYLQNETKTRFILTTLVNNIKQFPGDAKHIFRSAKLIAINNFNVLAQLSEQLIKDIQVLNWKLPSNLLKIIIAANSSSSPSPKLKRLEAFVRDILPQCFPQEEKCYQFQIMDKLKQIIKTEGQWLQIFLSEKLCFPDSDLDQVINLLKLNLGMSRLIKMLVCPAGYQVFRVKALLQTLRQIPGACSLDLFDQNIKRLKILTQYIRKKINKQDCLEMLLQFRMVFKENKSLVLSLRSCFPQDFLEKTMGMILNGLRSGLLQLDNQSLLSGSWQ